MMKTMMKKLEALNKIKEYMKIVESNIMEVKKLIEFAHAETIDLKDGTLKNLIIPAKSQIFRIIFLFFILQIETSIINHNQTTTSI